MASQSTSKADGRIAPGDDDDRHGQGGTALAQDSQCAKVEEKGLSDGNDKDANEDYTDNYESSSDDEEMYERGGNTTRSPSPPKEKKDKPTKRLVNGQWTGYAYRTPTTVYKLYRDSPLIDEFKSLANEDDQKEFIKKHGIAQPRR